MIENNCEFQFLFSFFLFIFICLKLTIVITSSENSRFLSIDKKIIYLV